MRPPDEGARPGTGGRGGAGDAAAGALPSALVDLLADLEAVVVAELAENGAVRRANRGFRRLVESDDAWVGPGAPWCLQPSFGELRERGGDGEPAAEGPGAVVYAGLLTVGNPDGPSQTLRASVRRHDGGWLVTGEVDVEAMERLSRQALELNQDLAQRQRELTRAHRLLRQRETELEHLSRTDALTDLANRRRFMQRLGEEVARCVRSGEALSLALVDIDAFKGVNDRHGHPVGDVVLRATAQRLRQGIRPYDVAGRLGGDEFALLLVGADAATARAVCERIREGLPTLRDLPAEVAVRVSMGVAELARRGRSDVDAAAETLLERADRVLYRAKNAGGDRVEVDADAGSG